MLKQIAMIAVAMIMVLSTVAAISAADVQPSANTVNVGNYTMSENVTTGAMYNVSFVNDNFEAQLANSVNATGVQVTSLLLSGMNADRVTNFGNMTIFTAGNENTLFFASASRNGVPSSVTVNLTSYARQVSLTLAQQSYIEEHSGSTMSTFLSNRIFEFSSNNSNFLVFSNQRAVMSDANHTLTFTSGSTQIGATTVGITSTAALKDTIENELGNHAGAPFTYNNVTGAVSGRFVSFNFNESTGLISNFGNNNSGFPVFTDIQASGNGSIGVNNPSPVYPTAQPIIVGGVFFYGNNTVVYQMHDNPSMVSNFYLSNGTLNLSVANGLNITVYKPIRDAVEHEALNVSNVNFTSVNLGDQYDMGASSTVIFLHNSTFRASLFVHGAVVTNSSGNLTITTNGTAHVTFVAPPGLQDLKRNVQDAIQNAIEHNRLAALVVLGSAGNGNSNLTVSYNGSMQISVQNVSSNSVTVKVNSLRHEGTNFAVFVPNGVISNSSKITLTFDSETITLSSSVNSVLNATSDVNASFYYISVNGGTLVVIHVPHFSSHTIQISTASSSPGNTGLPGLPGSDGLYVIAGIVVVIAVIAGVVVAKRRK